MAGAGGGRGRSCWCSAWNLLSKRLDAGFCFLDISRHLFRECPATRSDWTEMPRYDFKCKACNLTFEVRMSMSDYSDGKEVECPHCGSPKVGRSYTSVSVLTGSRGGSTGGAAPPPNCGHGGFT